ncbi:RecX family transcriptional regulator [Curtobacterium caseinilyticum]|uniref:Regulatory protein RecX n=1 Tax=Curtobacterium caseinilyticum TaxID=3055137 RepID=A0ABT7TSB9_9MICO|nr:RecX family transcriptional regulator [Curtobacterium caseinilyticum]MDM7892507.1 RecX family transcriptional regulator [Curtobacterium caseinilyticum]
MTDAHDHDEGLAPVTDLFGARSRRGRPAQAAETGSGAGATERRATPPHQDTAGHRVPGQDGAGVPGQDADDGARPQLDAVGAQDDETGDASDVLPLRGQRAQAEWLSPVVGDGTGRTARAEQRGYDGEQAEATSASVFAIGTGDEIDAADAPRPLDEQRADAERVSMRALGRKGVSESEMRKLLLGQDLDADVVEHEVARLTRVGLLDDVALATDLVDRLHERKGLGRQGVVTELRRRGIDQAAIDAALEAAADDADDEFVRAIELAEKRARQLRGLDRETAERRLSGFLMRKGYGSGVVRVAVQRALDGSPRRSPSGGGTVRFE